MNHSDGHFAFDKVGDSGNGGIAAFLLFEFDDLLLFARCDAASRSSRIVFSSGDESEGHFANNDESLVGDIDDVLRSDVVEIRRGDESEGAVCHVEGEGGEDREGVYGVENSEGGFVDLGDFEDVEDGKGDGEEFVVYDSVEDGLVTVDEVPGEESVIGFNGGGGRIEIEGRGAVLINREELVPGGEDVEGAVVRGEGENRVVDRKGRHEPHRERIQFHAVMFTVSQRSARRSCRSGGRSSLDYEERLRSIVESAQLRSQRRRAAQRARYQQHHTAQLNKGGRRRIASSQFRSFAFHPRRIAVHMLNDSLRHRHSRCNLSEIPRKSSRCSFGCTFAIRPIRAQRREKDVECERKNNADEANEDEEKRGKINDKEE